jgi:hypothetical protein
MRVRVLDLDGSITAQPGLLRLHHPDLIDLRGWGPALRLACPWRRFYRFERALDRRLRSEDEGPALSFYGSGDFHHVSLALLRRLHGPFNLLVLDKHPDWMRGVPLLHCGTWLYHAARLPQVRQIFHVGGETDFDNAYRWLAPTPQLHSGKIVVIPAVRTFRAGFWRHVEHAPLRREPATRAGVARLEALLWPYRDSLRRVPLYISVDKDVLMLPEAVVNWDSGLLRMDEVSEVVQAFCRAAGQRLAGADVVGDWSQVRTRGWFSGMLDRTEHPALDVEPYDASRRNQQANLTLASLLTRGAAVPREAATAA